MKALLKIGVLLLISVALAQPAMSENVNTMSLKMFVVYASNDNTHVDGQLNFVKEELGSLFHYTSYELLETPVAKLHLNEAEQLTLKTGHDVFVRYLGVHGNRIHLRIQVKNKNETVVNTDFELVNGGNVMVGGPSYKKGVLILVVHGVY